VNETTSIIRRYLHRSIAARFHQSAFRERYEDRAPNDAARTSPVQGLPR
jgi:hypothetical protein